MDLGVRLVSKAMGGAVKIEKLHDFPWVLHLSELKFQLQSNVIPIGLINKGIYCHRALLFKVTLTHISQSIFIVFPLPTLYFTSITFEAPSVFHSICRVSK